MKVTKSRNEREGGYCGKVKQRHKRAGWRYLGTMSRVCGHPVYESRFETLRELRGYDYDDEYGYDF